MEGQLHGGNYPSPYLSHERGRKVRTWHDALLERSSLEGTLQSIIKADRLGGIMLLNQHVVEMHGEDGLRYPVSEDHAYAISDLKTLHETKSTQQRRVITCNWS